MAKLLASLSPMAGFTAAPMRYICTQAGAVRTYTEMTNASALARDSAPSWQLLETLEGEGKPIAHLYGTVPDDFAKAAEKIAATGRFAGFDINAGCPAPKITRSGAGSALMRSPKLIGDIVRAIKGATGMRVSVKTRLGYSPTDITIFRVLDEIVEAGCDELLLHGRYRHQGHSGEVAFDLVREVKLRSPIPVWGNGGVRDYQSALEFVEKTGVDGLLVGQGAIGHPWVFEDIAQGNSFRHGENRSHKIDLDEIRKTFLLHLDLERRFIESIYRKYPTDAPEDTPEMITVIRFRMHLFRYFSGFRGVVALRGKLAHIMTLEEIRSAANDCIACESAFRARIH